MILIAGISGFIGKKLAISLRRAGYEVCGLTNTTEQLSIEGMDFPVYPSSKCNLSQLFTEQKIEHVVNLAVEYGRNDEGSFRQFDTNCRLPIDLYLLADHYGAQSFIQTGTFFEKQPQADHCQNYVQTKRAANLYCRRLKLNTPFIVMQLEHVYGPGDNPVKLLPHVAQQLISGVSDIPLGCCNFDRDLIYVDDVVNAYVTILKNVNIFENKVVEVGRGESVNLQTVVQEMAAMIKTRFPQAQGKLSFSTDLKNQLLCSYADTTILKEAGWRPMVSVNDGLKRLISDLKG